MAIFEIDISVESEDVETFTQDVELDGVVYALAFKWNRRDESWTMSVYQPDGTLLAGGRKLVVGFPLLRGEIDTRLPAGELMCVDLSARKVEPEQTEIGRRVILAYYDEEEVDATIEAAS